MNAARIARSMNVIAYAVSKGRSYRWLRNIAARICLDAGANGYQVATAIGHGVSVRNGNDYPNWE